MLKREGAPRPERSPSNRPLPGGVIVQGILRTNTWAEIKASGKSGWSALNEAAQQLSTKVKDKNHGYSTTQSRQLDLVAALPGWLNAQQQLDNSRNNSRYRLSRQQKEIVLGRALKFNDALRELIDNEDYTKISQVLKFIKGVMVHTQQPDNLINYATEQARTALVGMQHEIIAQSVISGLDGVWDVRPATADEDLQGNDLFLQVGDDQGPEYGIDIKARPEAADRANEEALLHSRLGYYAVWSGVYQRDLGDDMLPDEEDLRGLKGHYKDALYDLLSLHNNARQTGTNS